MNDWFACKKQKVHQQFLGEIMSDKTPFFSIGDDELASKPKLEKGKKWKCPTCGEEEDIKNSKTYDDDLKQYVEDDTLQYVKHKANYI